MENITEKEKGPWMEDAKLEDQSLELCFQHKSSMYDLDGAKIRGFISLGTLLRALASFSRTAAVTGKLEVRLMGCQDLIEDVPGQHTTPHTYQMTSPLPHTSCSFR
jgi:hypothetical protein